MMQGHPTCRLANGSSRSRLPLAWASGKPGSRGWACSTSSSSRSSSARVRPRAWSCRVRKRRRRTCQDPHRPGEPPRVRHVAEPVGPIHPHELQDRQDQRDPADDGAVQRLVEISHEPCGQHDTEAGRRQHAAHVVPACVLMKGADCGDIADEEERQDHAGGRTRAQEESEDEDVEQAHPREPGFPDAHAKGSRDREDPFANRHVGCASHHRTADSAGKGGMTAHSFLESSWSRL